MYARKKKRPFSIIMSIISIALICGGIYYASKYDNEIELYENSRALSKSALTAYIPTPFINSADGAEPYVSQVSRDDALFYFDAPEGFTIISHSEAWDWDMLELLYDELKLNTHGDEIGKLDEIIVHPHDDDEMHALATYSPSITTAYFISRFPAFPDDFSVGFPIYTGRINIYGGDTKTTIESIASSLSHEYGHHYTFYYMFDNDMRQQGLLGESEYAHLREARLYNLIESVERSPDYFPLRHRYIIEIAAEDYVILMGSPTTRQVIDYYDVRQLLEDSELSGSLRTERNAFPQENMMIPLASDVPGLSEYYHSYIGAEPRVPIEEKQEIILQFNRQAVEHNLVSGPRTFVHFTIRWNTPYEDAIYTIACYDPFDYSHYIRPIKTVHPGRRASAVIGEYVVERGNMIHTLNDEIAQGVKVFFVVAQLPDGTYYTSEMHEYDFG